MALLIEFVSGLTPRGIPFISQGVNPEEVGGGLRGTHNLALFSNVSEKTTEKKRGEQRMRRIERSSPIHLNVLFVGMNKLLNLVLIFWAGVLAMAAVFFSQT